MDYRPEVDGLRAIAVMSVILSHSGLRMFSGGFVGVDVFFVISGYLITSIILADLERGNFSIVNFYERRARRILPALFLVMLVCIPFAWFWLLPRDMKDFSQSLFAVSTFSSNILFWSESGYFDTEAGLKPLLHTWSLAVEEQYYLFFPPFLMLCWKLCKRWIVALLGIMFVVSLAAAQWAVYAMPAAAYYLLPARVWELNIGAIAAYYLYKTNRKKISRATGEVCGWFGVVLILYAVFTFSEETRFPGLYALVPTLGAVLIILFATQQTGVGRSVGNKAFVGIGVISYSAYLWHQPLFAFARYKTLLEPSYPAFLALSVLALVLAYFSWKYVEAPFRKSGKIAGRTIVTLSFSFSLFFVSVGYFGHAKNGFDDRIDRVLLGDIGHEEFHKYLDEKYFDCEPKAVAESALSYGPFLRCKQSHQGTPEIVLLGDSHAEHLFLGLAENLPDKNLAFYIQDGEPYVGNLVFKPIFDELLSNGQTQQIIFTMYYLEKVDPLDEGFYEGFSSTIKALLKAGKSVTLVGDVPSFNLNPIQCLARKLNADCILSIEDVERQRMIYDDVLDRLANEFRLNYVRIDETFCSDKICSMSQGDSILYRDNHHLNIIGSKTVGRFLAAKLSVL
jgi:peptidoglycan/LPS O-acetylase OafA/YrhL